MWAAPLPPDGVLGAAAHRAGHPGDTGKAEEVGSGKGAEARTRRHVTSKNLGGCAVRLLGPRGR